MTAEALTVDSLCVRYGSGPPVIDRVSLPPLPGGGITALVGPNGAGKSTLLRGIAGLRPAGGMVRLGPVDLAPLRPAERARIVSFMPQALPARLGFTVYESLIAALSVGRAASGEAAAERAVDTLERLGILALAGTPLDRLSGGQKQLASLAQSLVRQPRVLLLDEPTSALDLNFQIRVMELVAAVAAETGAVVIAVLHDLALACRWAETLVVLQRGRLAAAGAPASVMNPALLAAVYGVDASVDRDASGHVRIAVRGRIDPGSAGPAAAFGMAS